MDYWTARVLIYKSLFISVYFTKESASELKITGQGIMPHVFQNGFILDKQTETQIFNNVFSRKKTEQDVLMLCLIYNPKYSMIFFSKNTPRDTHACNF